MFGETLKAELILVWLLVVEVGSGVSPGVQGELVAVLALVGLIAIPFLLIARKLFRDGPLPPAPMLAA